MQFHTNGLTSVQLDLLQRLSEVINKEGFYLGGGTAISIYFGHRGSADLDWFQPAALADPLVLAQHLRDGGIPFVTESVDRGTLHGSVNQVRLSFLEYRYELLQPLTHWEERRCSLASLDDLACMKLAAVAQRGSRKDFIDVYTLVNQYKSLLELLKLYQKKYKTENLAPVLMGLAFFDDAEDEPDPPLWTEEWKNVKSKILAWVRKI